MRSLVVLLLSMALSLSGCVGDGDDSSSEGTKNDGEGTGDIGNDASNETADADGDGVPDDEDVCDGHDDSVDSDGDGTPDGCDDTPDGDPEPEPPRGAETWDVLVQDNSFSPATLTIQAGDSVRFIYDGSNPHTATADNGEFDSGDCPGTTCFSSPVGAEEYTWESSTDHIGDVPYACEVHSSMTGTITVMERYDPTPA